MKKLLLLILLLSPFLLSSCQKDQLSRKEKTDDFLYLYDVLKENYVGFDLATRRSGTEWLSKKDEYLEKLRSTANDTAYIRTLNAILGALQDDHTGLFPTMLYHNIPAHLPPEYKPWKDAMEKDYDKAKRWKKIMQSANAVKADEEQGERPEIISHYSDTIFRDKSIAVMNIPSFMVDLIALDSLKIDKFLSGLQDIESLIINIQGNTGGGRLLPADKPEEMV